VKVKKNSLFVDCLSFIIIIFLSIRKVILKIIILHYIINSIIVLFFIFYLFTY